MELKEWQSMAVKSVGLLAMILLIGILGINHQHTVKPISGETEIYSTEVLETDVSNVEKIDVQLLTDDRSIQRPGKRCIEIKKIATGQAIQARLENDYMHSTLTLTLDGEGAEQYDRKNVERWYGKKHYTGKYQAGHDTVKDMKVHGGEQQRIVMDMNCIYEASLFESDEAWFIVLDKPWETYEHVLVVDAGHGGDDEGTGSVGWKYREKEYALLVTKALKEILDNTSSIKTYYTRLSDVDVSKRDRLHLANAVHADLFISVHCNASEQTETTANGIETLYSTMEQTSNDTLTSKELAKNILGQVCQQTGRQKRKVIKRNDLYLLHHAKMPITIVEVGYMTNTSDMKYLLEEDKRTKIARGIYLGIVKSL